MPNASCEMFNEMEKVLRGASLELDLCPAHMTIEELAGLLAGLGCPVEKSTAMAAQLDKRARQLAEAKDRTYQEALEHLLRLMSQGWAAKERGF